MVEKPITNFSELVLKEIFKHSIIFYPNGQKKKEQFYTDGLLLFKEINYSESGQIREIINYKAESNEVKKYFFAEEKVKSGMLICYHENGSVQSQKYYVGGKIHWEEKFFSEAGQLLEIISYKKGIKAGPHKIYNDRGILLSEIYFDNNIPDGPATFYYNNGLTKSIVNYKNGKKCGISKLYYENGILKFEENFENDVLEGFIRTFYKSGGIKEDWQIHNGIPEGNSIFFYKDGTIYGVKNYKSGIEHGPAKFYYENGKLKEELNYFEGLKDGSHKFYDPDGKLEKECIYENGILTQENFPEIEQSQNTISNVKSGNMARTMNYVGISAASLFGIYLLYTLAIYLFG